MLVKWVVLLIGFASVSVHALDAVYGSDLSIPAGTEIRFKSYSNRTRSYKVINVKLPGEGIWDVSVESAARSIKTLALDDLKKNPRSVFKKKDFHLDKDMTVLNEDELAERLKRSRSR